VTIWRVHHRIAKQAQEPKAKHPLAHYLRENFYVTTSGNFRSPALASVVAEVGVDCVLYSLDYPIEEMTEAAECFDRITLSDGDRDKIAYVNAQRLFHL